MIKKLSMESKNILSENIENVASLFPNALVETENGKKIDFDILRQELSGDIVEGSKERYHLDFPGKREAIVEANRKINKTLRPIKEKSVDFDNTKNIYIEGDNLEALKILQESYLGKIKCIYIDPPYNTGNDFVYNDKFSHTTEEELKASGRMDEDGNVLISKDINNDSNGRYHSDWLKMMYPRLKLARNLLSDDGVIFISIDDNEVENLRKECNEIFGENNFVTEFCWVASGQKYDIDENINNKKIKVLGANLGMFKSGFEYVLCYRKSFDFKFELLKSDDGIIDSRITKNGNNISKLVLKAGLKMHSNLTKTFNGTIGGDAEKIKILNKEGAIFVNGVLQNDIETEASYASAGLVREYLSGNEVVDNRGQKVIEVFFQNSGIPYIRKQKSGDLPSNVLSGYGDTSKWREKLASMLGCNAFNYPKPTDLLADLLLLHQDKNCLVLDFFSGSATTAHAVMKLNAEDGGNRQFILVQLPEATDEKSEAYKAGYKTICDIGEERIRRAGKKIKEENPMLTQNLDTGFRVYKVDSSNMKDIYYTPDKIDQANILDMVSNVKEDRTAEDLLTQVILNLGLPLDLHIDEKMVGNNKLFFVEENALVACFDETIDLSILDEIEKVQPLKICLRESSFTKDQDKINFFEKIKKLLPDIEVTII